MGNKRLFAISVLAMAVLVTLAVSVVTPFAAAQGTPPTPPRSETLIMGGNLYSPPTNWNPLVPYAAVTGTIGLLYETLYLYNPINSSFIPWLANGPLDWLNSSALEIQLKPGAYWWDGVPISSQDIYFTFVQVPRLTDYSIYYAAFPSWLTGVSMPNNQTIIFVFNQSTVNYPDLYYDLANVAILPEHVLYSYLQQVGVKALSMNELGTNTTSGIIASGPYRVWYTTDSSAWFIRVDNWWGAKYFGIPGPKYLENIIVFGNQLAEELLVTGQLDWSTFFIPGITALLPQYPQLVTFYPTTPYYLPANTVYLFMNDQKPPFNYTAFRRAIYYALNIQAIQQAVYQNGVNVSTPVGLQPLPANTPFINNSLIAQYSYSYNPQMAEQILNAAGFKMGPNGYRTFPNGTALPTLTIQCPYGWTDWMSAIEIIVQNLQAVGIPAQAYFPAYGVYANNMYQDTFDMLLNNFGSYAEASPYLLYDWLLYPNAPPVGQFSYSGNFGRYFNTTVTNLLNEISHVPPSDTANLERLYSQLQQILLQQMPYVPLWYNSYWFQGSTQYWTGWPTVNNPYAVPTNWNGRWADGAGVLVLLHLRPTQTVPTTVTTPTPTSTMTSPTVTTPTPTTPTSTSSAPITPVPTTTAQSSVSAGLIVAIVVVVVIVILAVVLLARRRR